MDDSAVAADLDVLREVVSAGDLSVDAVAAAEVATPPARILAGLLARRAAGVGALTVLPCDNIPDNGSAFGRVVTDAARAVDESLVGWMDELVSEVAEAEGYEDVSPVPTEPFSEWVISGQFPAGRPDWESAGATIVDEVEPYEQRKLWMLNGSHTLMAYAAPILGLETVYDAITNETVRGWVKQWWAEAGSGLSVPWEEYADKLIERFENPNIRHLLAQIAADGSQKLPVRTAPTLVAFREKGELPVGAIRAVAAWTLHLRGLGAPVKDAAADRVQALVVGGQGSENLEADVRAVLGYVAPSLAEDDELVAAVVASAEEIVSLA